MAAAAAVFTACLWVVTFPFGFWSGEIHSLSEGAYLFLVPLLLWLSVERPRRQVIIVSLAASWTAWVVLLWWLRHVTLPGTFILSLVLALFTVVWSLAAAWAFPVIRRKRAGPRLLGMAGLAALWVLLEWVRTWLFSGFPWLPLAASQWDRPALLQILPYTGMWSLSFLLVFFNLALSSYFLSLIQPVRHIPWWRRLRPELYAALGMVGGAAFIAVPALKNRGARDILFSAGIVQPYIAQELKWDESRAREHLKVLERLSAFAEAQGADVLLWPEAATPWPVIGNTGQREWVEALAEGLDLPILMGAVAALRQPGEENVIWYNGIFVATPEEGLADAYYSKQKLVPFGEFNPLSFLPWELHFLQLGSFTPGVSSEPLELEVNHRPFSAGALVCYEDIFPNIARLATMHGADFLYVATNNAWYGEEAGAYQHAVHSVLRAVENRRPVVRVGNGGWSGWIDEYGSIRYNAIRPHQGVYFEGTDVVAVSRDLSWAGRTTLYSTFGDWFIVLCALVTFLGWQALRRGEDEPLPEEELADNARERARELLRKGKFGRLR